MADVLCNNPFSLRSCILYEFIEGNEPFETYQKLIKKLGDEFMTYPEFEFWYMRFAQGKYDLDYDRSLDPKTRLFTDLPVEIFDKVGDSLNLNDRFALRNVSKDMQEIVDSWAPRVTDMELWDNWNITESTIPSQEVECDEDSNENWMSLFKNPKLRLETLMLNCWTRNKLRFLERNCFNHKIHVKKFKMRTFCSIRSIFLNMLDRETLEEVSLPITRQCIEKLDEFLSSDHLKDIKMLNITTDLCPSELPLMNFFQNLPRLTIEFVGKGVEGRWDDFKDRFIKKLADFIKYFLNSTQLQFCHLTGRFSLDMESIMIELQSREIMVPGFPNVRRYPILGSNEFYEIEFNGGGYGGYGILHDFEIQIKRKQ